MAVANALQLEAARATPVFSAWITSSKSLNYQLPYSCWYIAIRCDLFLWPLTFDLEHLQCIACDVMKLCTKFECSRAIRRGVIAVSIFELMTLNIVLRVALGSVIIFTKFDLQQLIRAWIIAFFDADTLSHLWPVDLESTSSVTWSKSVRNLSEIEQSAAELLITLLIFAHVVSRCDLDRSPLDFELLQHFGCRAFVQNMSEIE